MVMSFRSGGISPLKLRTSTGAATIRAEASNALLKVCGESTGGSETVVGTGVRLPLDGGTSWSEISRKTRNDDD